MWFSLMDLLGGWGRTRVIVDYFPRDLLGLLDCLMKQMSRKLTGSPPSTE
jgi:hypothetical protein